MCMKVQECRMVSMHLPLIKMIKQLGFRRAPVPPIKHFLTIAVMASGSFPQISILWGLVPVWQRPPALTDFILSVKRSSCSFIITDPRLVGKTNWRNSTRTLGGAEDSWHSSPRISFFCQDDAWIGLQNKRLKLFLPAKSPPERLLPCRYAMIRNRRQLWSAPEYTSRARVFKELIISKNYPEKSLTNMISLEVQEPALQHTCW